LPTEPVIDAPTPPVGVRPRFRGSLHTWSFVATVPLAALALARAETRAGRIAVVVYGIGMAAMFGVSALYHRVTWSPPARQRMRRLDHSTIFLAIAGTYTPVVALGVGGGTAKLVLTLVWAGTLVGIAIANLWPSGPKPLIAAPYILVGWVAIGVMPRLLDELGRGSFVLLVLGGLLYTAGAVIYAIRRPSLWPATFGYHELFHALVSAAAFCHYAVVLSALG
jgi:hemolysin III